MGFFSEQRYFTNELSTNGLVYNHPTTFGTYAFSLSRFGFSSFNQTNVGIATAKKISSSTSIGFQLNYLHSHIERYPSLTSIYISLGILSKITNNITIGSKLFNPTRPVIGNFQKEKSPILFSIGANYKKDDYQAFLDIEKSSNTNFNTKIGLVYCILNNFYARIGFNTEPSETTAGFGFKKKNIQIDFATAYLQQLGFTPSFSLTYEF